MREAAMTDLSKTPELIDSKAVKPLVEAQALRGATILGQPGGWAVVIRYGNAERVIAAQKSRRMRLWRHVDTAVSFIRGELHMDRFEVDAAEHDAHANEIKRPDQAERLRKQREAAGYDAWFRAKVQEGLDAIERGEVVSHEEAEADFARMMDEA
jgi:hypothetical protein